MFSSFSKTEIVSKSLIKSKMGLLRISFLAKKVSYEMFPKIYMHWHVKSLSYLTNSLAL
jgi:hypothetical protein